MVTSRFVDGELGGGGRRLVLSANCDVTFQRIVTPVRADRCSYRRILTPPLDIWNIVVPGLDEQNGVVDATSALALLQLDIDLEFPRRVAEAIGDPSLAADIEIEFDAGLDWLIMRLTSPDEEPVTLNDVIKLGFDIWDCMPADLVGGDPAAADVVEHYLDHVVMVVRGIVIDAAPTEL